MVSFSFCLLLALQMKTFCYLHIALCLLLQEGGNFKVVYNFLLVKKVHTNQQKLQFNKRNCFSQLNFTRIIVRINSVILIEFQAHNDTGTLIPLL